MENSSAVAVQDSGVQHSGLLRPSIQQSLVRQTDEELLSQVRGAAAREREATEVVLRYLLEVERRKLYLKRGFPSLFDFCVQELGYCAGSAHLRIQSMRLLREVSEEKRVEIGEKLASGRLTLSQLSNLQTYSRQAYPRRVEPERKLEILAQVEGESTRQSQKIILEALGMQVAALERMRIRGPDQVELTVTLTGEAVELLEEWKVLTSHANAEGRNGEAILAALRVAVEQGRKKKGVRAVRECDEAGGPAPGASASLASPRVGSVVRSARHSLHAHEVRASNPVVERGVLFDEAALSIQCEAKVPVPGEKEPIHGMERTGARAIDKNVPKVLSSTIPSSIRRLVWHRDGGRCTFVDSRSGRRCDGRRYLEVDHIRQRAHGGGHELANLRLLCGAHHRWRHQ